MTFHCNSCDGEWPNPIYDMDGNKLCPNCDCRGCSY